MIFWRPLCSRRRESNSGVLCVSKKDFGKCKTRLRNEGNTLLLIRLFWENSNFLRKYASPERSVRLRNKSINPIMRWLWFPVGSRSSINICEKMAIENPSMVMHKPMSILPMMRLISSFINLLSHIHLARLFLGKEKKPVDTPAGIRGGFLLMILTKIQESLSKH